MFQDPDLSDSLVPTLLRLTIERIAELIKKNKLSMSGSVITGDLTNQVIGELRRSRSLNYETMKRILTSNQFVVDSIFLEDIDFKLAMCFNHDLLSFRIGDLNTTSTCRKIFVHRVLKAALNKTSLKQLKNLDLSGEKPLNLTWPIFVAKNLRALECLSFANRDTTERTWARFKGKFSQLRCLNISNTGITDITCISGLQNLQVLIMHDLNITKGNTDVLTHLKKLEVLDISRSTGDGVNVTTDTHLDLVHGIYGKSVNAIENGTTTPWPEFRALDISGLHFSQQGIDQTIAFVEKIVRAHPNLTEIGLLETQLNYVDVQVPGRNLQVYNEASRKSLLKSLSHYKDLNHPAFVWTLLLSIEARLETEYAEFSPEELKACLDVVCLTLHRHQAYSDIEYTGLSCLFQLSDNERTRSLSLTEVKSIIDVCLDAVDSGNHYGSDSDDNISYTRDHVFCIFWSFWDKGLVGTNGINLFRIVRTSLTTMMLNGDAETDKRILYTLSIVTPKLERSEKKELSKDGKYVKQLVNKMVVLEAEFREATNEDEKGNATDILNSTLTTLWELQNIPAFLRAQGITIAIRVLTTFQDCLVQTKTLGILSKIAVNNLEGQQFCKSENISVLITCLDGDFQETDSKKLRETVARSHKASFVLAHLLLLADDIWQCSMQKKIVCQKLQETTARYPNIVDRSAFTFESDEAFDAFYSMICISESNGAGMLILWTVLHLLMTDNVKTPEGLGRYMDMLLKSNLCPMVKSLAEGVSEHIQDLDNRVVLLAKKVLEFVDAHNIEN